MHPDDPTDPMNFQIGGCDCVRLQGDPMAANTRPKVVYLLVEVGDNTYWNRAGVAFENQDGSLNMKLDLFPQVTFNIREPKDNGDEKEMGKKKR